MKKKLPDNYLEMSQHSPEWLIARIGQITSSRIADVVAKRKRGDGYLKAREDYKIEKLTEVLTGRAADHYVSPAMEFGIENEGLARTTYEMEKAVSVDLIGYVRHHRIPRCGASPDGLVGDDGLCEFKVPNTTTHLEYLLAETIPEEYLPQMMWQLACTGRQWNDFVSYDPRLPEDFGLLIVRMQRDDKIIAAMEAEVEKFIGELNELCEKLKAHARPNTAGPGPSAAEIPEWVEP